MAAKNVASDYDGRIRRAERLAALHPFTQEVLTFYKQDRGIPEKFVRANAIWQQAARSRQKSSGFARELKIEGLLPHFQEFLKLVAESAPVTLAESARQLSTQSPEAWTDILQDYWATSGRDDRPNAAFDQFLPRAFLQPYAENLAIDRAAA